MHINSLDWDTEAARIETPEDIIKEIQSINEEIVKLRKEAMALAQYAEYKWGIKVGY